MAKMKVVQVPRAGADFEIVEREIPQPGPDQVRIKVQACGVCHSDILTKEGGWPGLTYPRVPGHEIAGLIDEVGARGCAVLLSSHIVEDVERMADRVAIMDRGKVVANGTVDALKAEGASSLEQAFLTAVGRSNS